MANERIFKDGVLTPAILVGVQGSPGTQYGSITYNSTSNTIQINSNLQVAGDLHQINTINSTFNDNILTLSKPASGDPAVALAESGIEIARPSGPGSYATFKFIEASQSWVSQFINGTGIKIKSSAVPTQNDDLTNKLYVDGLFSTLTLGLNDLTDVTLTAPSNNQILLFNGSQWINAPIPPAGISNLTLVGTGGLSSERWNGSAWVSDSVVGDVYTSTLTSNGQFRINLINQSGAPAGSYINPTITLNSKGIITAITEKNSYRTFSGNSGSGSPTSTSANFAINGAAGDISSSVSNTGATLSLSNTSVAPGTYSNATFTVDSKGRLTNATGGSSPVLQIASSSGANITPNGAGLIGLRSGIGVQTETLSSNEIRFNLLPSGVAAGNYNYTNVSIDAYGRITAASSGNPPSIATVTSQSGSYTAPGLGATLSVVGANGVTTSMSGNTLTVNASGIDPFLAGGLNLSINGWARFRGGLIIQWGRANSPGGGTTTVSFPAAFPNACLSIAIGARPETAGDDSQPRTSGINAQPTASGFSAVWRSGFIDYIAIGY